MVIRAAAISLILTVSPLAPYVQLSTYGQTLDPSWGAPVDAQGAAARAEKAARERLDRMEYCYRFPDSPSEGCRVQREDDRRPSERHHERQVLEKRWY